MNFAKLLRTPFLTERLRWLLLAFINKEVQNNLTKQCAKKV